MSFVEEYFDGKPLAELKKTITPAWTDQNLNSHLELIRVPPNAERVLEVGSGIGRILKKINSPGVECVGFDASLSMCREASQYLKGENAVVLHCPGDGTLGHLVEPGTFDFAFAFTVFQHIPDTDAVVRYLQSMVEALRPGGIVVAQFLNEHMSREGEPLWTYHDLDLIRDSLKVLGTTDQGDTLTKNWTVLRYRKGPE
jgi:SAM-dependent methyltransferase